MQSQLLPDSFAKIIVISAAIIIGSAVNAAAQQNAVSSTPVAIVMTPAPQITGYNWQQRWVTVQNPCTKSGIADYDTVIWIFNTGTSAFRVASIELIGPDAPYFEFDQSDPATTLKPGAQVNAGDTLNNRLYQKVIFRPRDERLYQVIVRLVTDNGDTIETLLLGTGIESHITVTGFDFGFFSFWGGVHNGFAKLNTLPTRATTITDLQIIGSDAGNFQFDWARGTAPFNTPPPGAAWTNIAPGTSIDIPVNFAPLTSGAKIVPIIAVGDFSNCDVSVDTLKGASDGSSDVTSSGARAGSENAMMVTNHPNPFNSETTISYQLPHSGHVVVRIHDVQGRQVRLLVDAEQSVGAHEIVWDGIDDVGEAAPSGAYYYTLELGADVIKSDDALGRTAGAVMRLAR